MMYVNPNNRFISEIMGDKCYGFLHYYPVVVDIGANVGIFSMSMLDHADKIYAIEPVAENMLQLQENIYRNQLTKIIPRQLAISNVSFVKTMVKRGDPEDGGWSLEDGGEYPVDCRSLKDFFNAEEIDYADLVKIDVEGHELVILQAPGFPKERIGTIIGEMHYNDAKLRLTLKETLEWLGFRYMELPNSYFLARKK